MLPIFDYTIREFKAIFKKSWEWRIAYGLIGGFIVARWLGAFSSLELITLDFFLRHRPADNRDDHVVIVLIKTDSVQSDQSWSDRRVAELIETIFEAEPAVVGLNVFRGDAVDPLGRSQLIDLFEQHDNLIGVEKALPPQTIAPLPGVSEDIIEQQFGINDFSIDQDGKIRRVFIGSYIKEKVPGISNPSFRFSFSFKVAEQYLNARGYTLESHPRDPTLPSFADSNQQHYWSIPKLRPTFGGYVRNEAIAPVQTLLNFRAGADTFEVINAVDLQNGTIDLEILADKAVIIGTDDAFFPRFLPISALSNSLDDSGDSPAIRRRLGITGTEFEAHAASQLINRVLSDRPLINSIHPLVEDLLIVLAGLGGILIGSAFREKQSSLWNGAFLGFAILCLLVISYSLLCRLGLWLPIVPTTSILATTGITYIAFYQSERLALTKARKLEEDAAKLLEERRKTIDRIFNSIHAGPLQTLAGLLRNVKDGKLDQHYLISDLKALNYEIRLIGESLRQEAIEDVYLADTRRDIRLELTHPMHEVFYEVYNLCLQKELPGFQDIKIRSVAFEPFECQHLNLEIKRKLCWFLQESLENVGKHAIGTTRLMVTGKLHADFYTLIIEDNGPGLTSDHIGEGTRFFQRLEEVLKGHYLRCSKPTGGTLCKLTWSLFKG